MLLNNLKFLWVNHRNTLFYWFFCLVFGEIAVIWFHQEWVIELVFYTTPLLLGVLITMIGVKKAINTPLCNIVVIILCLVVNEGFLATYMVYELIEHMIGHSEHHEVHTEHQSIENISEEKHSEH